MTPNPSVKFVPAFGLHGTRRKRRAPYLKLQGLPQNTSANLDSYRIVFS
jgi:hypothetical protein